SAITVVPGWGGAGTAPQGNDLAILRLPELAPSGPTGTGAERYDIYRKRDEIGQTFTAVGHGPPGNGLARTPPGPGGKKQGGTNRSGSNRYDAVEQVPNFGGRLFSDFDDFNPLQNPLGTEEAVYQEASMADGDSGCPVFLDGRIAGVHSYSHSKPGYDYDSV